MDIFPVDLENQNKFLINPNLYLHFVYIDVMHINRLIFALRIAVTIDFIESA
jgi:hypothetical protein